MLVFSSRQIPRSIFVIGCGGTGSRLVPLLTQFMRTVTEGVTPRGNVVNPTVYLVDGDEVEQKNLLRQNFIEADVGKNKASVLAARYGRAYGVNVVGIPRMFNRDIASTILDYHYANPLGPCMVIMCVDSAEARRTILSTMSTCNVFSQIGGMGPILIDAGNEGDFGQVRYSNFFVASREMSFADRLPAMTPVKGALHCLPIDIDYYREMQDNEGASCADLDQTLAINALMATMIMGIVQNVYYVRDMPYYAMSISLSSGVSTSMITPAYLDGISRPKSMSIAGGNTLPRFDISESLESYVYENLEALEAMGLDANGRPLRQTGAASDEVSAGSAAGEVGSGEAPVTPTTVEDVPARPAARRSPARSRGRATTATPVAASPTEGAPSRLPEGITQAPPLSEVRF